MKRICAILLAVFRSACGAKAQPPAATLALAGMVAPAATREGATRRERKVDQLIAVSKKLAMVET